jgi:hypothetical protein
MAKALPLISGTITPASVGISALAFDTTADAAHVAMIQDFFKLECHDDTGAVNFCPQGVTADATNKFTTTTLIGLVYHAEMKAKDIYSNNADYKNCQVNPTDLALTNHTVHYIPEGSTSSMTTNAMVLPTGDILDCLGTFTYDGNTSYSAYHKATDGNIFAYVSSRYKYTSTTNPEYGAMSDVFQGYMSSASGSSVLGFNLGSFHDKGGSNDYAVRVSLIANATSNKFAVKMDNGYNKKIAAIGKGGYDSSTNAYIDGYFVVRTNDGTTSKLYCIKNAAAPQIVAGTYCSDIVALLTDDGTTKGWSDATVTTYLGLAAPDTTYLAPFMDGDTSVPELGVKNTSAIINPFVACCLDGLSCDEGHFPETMSATAL